MILTNLNNTFIVITSLMKPYLNEFKRVYTIVTHNNHKTYVFVTLDLCFEKINLNSYK